MEDSFTSARRYDDQVNTTMNLRIPDLFEFVGEIEPPTSAVDGVRKAITGSLGRIFVRARISAMRGLQRLKTRKTTKPVEQIAAENEGTFLVDLSEILGEQPVEERVYHEPIDIRDIAEHVTLSRERTHLLLQVSVQMKALGLHHRGE